MSPSPPNEHHSRDHPDPPAGIVDLVRSLSESILAYLQARSQLLKLESKEASAAITRKALLYFFGACFLILAYTLALVAAIFLISRSTSYPWEYVTFAAAGIHILLAIILILIAKAPFRHGLFRHTLNELEKDRQWLKPKTQTKIPDPRQNQS